VRHSSFQFIQTHRKGPAAYLTPNRHDVRNADEGIPRETEGRMERQPMSDECFGAF
jgi:hypothetical protein